ARGTTINNQTAIAPGLNVSVIGGTAQIEAGSLRYYTQGFLLMTVNTGKVAANTPAAVALTLGNELYVLPAAFTVTPSAPPLISTVTGSIAADGTLLATVAGSGLSGNTRILFDGVPGQIASVNADGSVVAVPPASVSGHQAWVAAVNPDGQTSSQALGSATPPTFTFPISDAPSIFVDPPVVAAGTDALVTIRGIHTHFTQGQTVVGFGSSDLKIRRTWVTGPGS